MHMLTALVTGQPVTMAQSPSHVPYVQKYYKSEIRVDPLWVKL